MAIKSTKKVLASILSFAMILQPFCGAKDFIENKNIPQKSIVIKKEKPTVFNKIKEFAKKHSVKAAVGGVVGLGLAINYLVFGNSVKRDKLSELERKTIKQMIDESDKDDKANALTMKDVDDYIKGNHNKFVIHEDGTLEILDENITKIKIPNGVTTICENAFGYCRNLKKVTIPNSVTKIGLVAFCNTSLKNVTIPNKCEYNAEGWSRSFPANCKVIIRNETN